jgi:hypothetical protein
LAHTSNTNASAQILDVPTHNSDESNPSIPTIPKKTRLLIDKRKRKSGISSTKENLETGETSKGKKELQAIRKKVGVYENQKKQERSTWPTIWSGPTFRRRKETKH